MLILRLLVVIVLFELAFKLLFLVFLLFLLSQSQILFIEFFSIVIKLLIKHLAGPTTAITEEGEVFRRRNHNLSFFFPLRMEWLLHTLLN